MVDDDYDLFHLESHARTHPPPQQVVKRKKKTIVTN